MTDSELNPGIVNFLQQMTKNELILMVVRLHNANLAVRAVLSDMTWLEVEEPSIPFRQDSK